MGKENEVYEKAKKNYISRTKISKQKHDLAKNYMPGGETRTICFHKPYPLTIKEGKGSYLFDVDGNKYIDLLNNYTALVHGHANKEITKNVKSVISSGTAYAANIQEQTELAALLCRRVPSLDMVRFCNSGTEATMFAIRTARTFTKKTKIIKMEGSYHGTHDLATWSPEPSFSVYPKEISNEIFIAPFNDEEKIEKILNKNSDDVAAILVEPVMGVAGVLPPNNSYLRNLRKLANKHNVLLIFDEVQTLRLSVGGAQELFDTIPDLTTMGKIIGGGLPVGAFGGRKDIMKIFDPFNENYLPHGGTFNGNRATMVAGIEAINLLDAKKIKEIDRLTENLESRINKSINQLKIPACLTRVGSMMNIHFKSEKPTNYASSLTPNQNLVEILHLELLNRGIFIAPRGLINLSTAISGKDVEEIADATHYSLEEISPFIQQ